MNEQNNQNQNDYTYNPENASQDAADTAQNDTGNSYTAYNTGYSTAYNTGYHTGYNPYYPQKKKRSATPWIIGIAAGLVALLCLIFVVGFFFSRLDFSMDLVGTFDGGDDYIGVLHIEGTIASSMDTSLLYTSSQIYNHAYVLSAIETMQNDDENLGILLYIDSPGGEMYAGDELYAALMEYKETTERPIYAYFASMAASGGYYVAMAADEIYANRLCTTGSIGVTYGTHIDLSGLCEKLGITTEELTSGDNKAMGGYFSPLTEEQKEIYGAILEEYEGYFIDVIVEGRDMPREKVAEIADGRIFTATQALNLDLIDGISNYEGYIERVAKDFKGEVNFVDISYEMDYTELLGAYTESLAGLPSSEIAAVLATIKPLSGPVMYYSGH